MNKFRASKNSTSDTGVIVNKSDSINNFSNNTNIFNSPQKFGKKFIFTETIDS